MTLAEAYTAQWQSEDPYYRERGKVAACKAAVRKHSRQVTVSCGGFRWHVYLLQDGLAFIEPRSNSAGRFEFTLIPACADRQGIQLGNYLYEVDCCMRRRVAEALFALLAAWTAADNDIDAFYRALGQSGRCAICGATLTDPLSMSRGIGPECFGHIGIGRAAVLEVARKRVSRA